MPPSPPANRRTSGETTGRGTAMNAIEDSERLRKVSNRYPRQVADTYREVFGDVRLAIEDSDRARKRRFARVFDSYPGASRLGVGGGRLAV